MLLKERNLAVYPYSPKHEFWKGGEKQSKKKEKCERENPSLRQGGSHDIRHY